MAKDVTIVDYGLGNIFSVSRAFAHFGANVQLAERPEEIMTATRLVLPGVGAFANGMQGLRDRALIEPIQAYARSGRPLLGICLGMQMLLTTSYEFGEHAGLDLIPGTVRALSTLGADGATVKVPHIGWSALSRPATRATWDGTLMAGLTEQAQVYFVHSFAVMPDQEEHRLADTYYAGHRVSAAIQKGRIVGCQFHPEKSSANGLRCIQNFLLADD